MDSDSADGLLEMAAATAATTGRHRRTVVVPDYKAIVRGARGIRAMAAVFVFLAAGFLIGGIVPAGIVIGEVYQAMPGALAQQEKDRKAYQDMQRRVVEVEASAGNGSATARQVQLARSAEAEAGATASGSQQEVTRLTARRTAVLLPGIGATLVGVLLATVATILRMAAWLALAIRDAAINSFELRRIG